jgi:hypothetical protein
MKYFVFVVLLAAAVWYFFFNNSSAPDPSVRIVPASPEKQFAALFETGVVEAEKLGALCQAYPQVASQFLKNREFKLHGNIKDFRLTGIDGRRAEVLLRTGTQRQLIIVYNLDQYFRLGMSQRTKGKYSIVDTELFYINSEGTNRRLLFAKELETTQTVVTKSVGVTNVAFLAVTNAPSVGVF